MSPAGSNDIPSESVAGSTTPVSVTWYFTPEPVIVKMVPTVGVAFFVVFFFFLAFFFFFFATVIA
jgi:hypothetical protein